MTSATTIAYQLCNSCAVAVAYGDMSGLDTESTAEVVAFMSDHGYLTQAEDIRRTGSIKDRDEVVGNTTKVKVVKNKVAPPFREVIFDIMYGEGISKIGEILDLGVKAGIVEKSGAWFSFDSQRLGQGRENAKTFLKGNPDMAARIEATTSIRAASIASDAVSCGGMQKNATCTPGTYSVCFRIHDGEMMPSGNRGPPGYSGDSGERGGKAPSTRRACSSCRRRPARIRAGGILCAYATNTMRT